MAATGKTHHRVTWEAMSNPGEIIRSSIGGYPVLPADQSWPVCTEDDCNQPMALFFQLTIDDGFGLPFARGTVLSVFQCLKHDDPFEDLDTKSPKKAHDRLPDKYWQHANYAIFLASPDNQQPSAEREPSVTYSRLIFTREAEPKPRSIVALNFKDIKIGGSPFWIQKPKIWNCSCGSEMDFVCSLPGNLKYPRVEGSQRQPNVWSDGHHFLFLGLSTYVFACRACCNPRAVVAIRQN